MQESRVITFMGQSGSGSGHREHIRLPRTQPQGCNFKGGWEISFYWMSRKETAK